MTKTPKQLRKLGKALREDISHAAENTAKTLEQGVAASCTYVRNHGGLGSMIGGLFDSAVQQVGRGAGYVARTAQAAYHTVTGKETDKKETPPSTPQEQTEDNSVLAFLRSVRADFRGHYSESDIDPEEIAKGLGSLAQEGKKGLRSLFRKIQEGTDALSQKISAHIPTDADYKYTLHDKSYALSRALLTKPDIERAKCYLTFIDHAVPFSPALSRDKHALLTLVASKGIRSGEELREQLPQVYGALTQLMQHLYSSSDAKKSKRVTTRK
ncbi:MAG: hypothetical protein Q8L34_06525 [Candidatus Woesearchaeota archaeon]|nr:hypothetical protein [Candidatus Woesearchaeota archaeon]